MHKSKTDKTRRKTGQARKRNGLKLVTNSPAAQFEPIRFSRLRELGTRSPEHFLAWSEDLDDNLPLRLGYLCHAMLLGVNTYAIYPKPRRAGKEWTVFKDATKPGTRIFTLPEYETAHAMTESVLRNPLAVQVLKGVPEQTLEFTFMGVKYRTTPDVRSKQWLTELKSTRNAEPNWYQREALYRCYHVQLALQRLGCLLSGFGDISQAFIVSVESKKPFVTVVHELTPRALEKGSMTLRLWTERLQVCLDSGSWPGYTEHIVPFDIPEEFELKFAGDDDTDGSALADITGE